MLASQDALAVDRSSFDAGVARARWPARLQRLGEGPLAKGIETWIDGAHNGDAAAALAGFLEHAGPMHLVLGILANKDAEEIVALLAPHAASLTFVPVPDHEHHNPSTLAKRFSGRAVPSLKQALADLPGPRLIAGSLYLAGSALALNGELPD
jgi:dihydrofolate synthase/folylpolyglutamate synthase